MTVAKAGLLSLALIGCSAEADVDDRRDSWNGDFGYGPHAVGFRYTTLDRPTPGGTRELALSVWYPADASHEGDVMRVRDYFRGVLREGQLSETLGLTEEAAFAAAMTGSPSALSVERARRGLDASVMARGAGVPARGSFPVILWSSRHATILAQAPLAEALASHGFVVATAWSSDPPLAFLWEDRSQEDKIATIQAHTDDLARALDEVRRDPIVDTDEVLVLAWSYGGQTAARLQERDPTVRGIVAMDANIVPARPEESLELKRPLVYMVGRDTSGRGFDRLRHLTAPWVSIRFPQLAHGNFNALEGYLPAVLDTDTVYSWSLGGPVARDGYRALVRVVTAAAQALLSEDALTVLQIATVLQRAAEDTPVEVLTSAEPR